MASNNELARITPQQTTWNDEDKALIKQTVAKGASDAEFKLLLYTAAKYDLDPLIKQIWCVKYGEKPAAIYTSRDGFLHLAHKSGQFDGMETTALRNATGELTGARCTVWRKGYSHPFVVEVALSEYFVKQNQGDKPNQWAIRPETMIKKVAESQCLRRAFDISGLYEPGEIPEDGSVVETTARPVVTPLEPVELRPDISDRLNRAEEIRQETGVETMADSFGTWAKITQGICEEALEKLIQIKSIPEFGRLTGVEKLNTKVKETYPDADVAGKVFSALLHIAYDWRNKGKEHGKVKAHEEKNQTSTVTKFQTDTSNLAPEIQERLHRAAWIEEAAQVQTVTPAGKWMSISGDKFDRASRVITGGRDIVEIAEIMGIEKFTLEAKRRFPGQLKNYEQELSAGLHVLAKWCENHPAETIFPDVEGGAEGSDLFPDEEFDDDDQEYIK